MSEIAITVTVICERQTDAVRAAESLNRAMVGLALEGLSSSLTCTQLDDEKERP